MTACIGVEGVANPVIHAADFDATILLQYDVLDKACKKAKGDKRYYLDVVCCFDIEATNIKELRNAVMYVWQLQIGHALTVVGRTWEEYLAVLARIKSQLAKDQWLLIYVHNLSYEFQFFTGIYAFQPAEVFAVDKREILRCDMLGCIEYRCSYYLSNDSLDHWSKTLRVEHQKQSGKDFDYSILRWPWTELSPEEIRYAVYDVLAVVECVEVMLRVKGDTLATIPLTNTGYVRRMVRNEMLELGHWYTRDHRPTYELYELLREAFRGGNCHCNRWYAGITVENVYSADRSSSYPDVLCNCKFPVSKFIKARDYHADVGELVKDHRAFVCHVELIGHVQLQNPYWGHPYLAKDKCVCAGEKIDNGRILEADYVKTAVTDIDLRIILREYTCDSIEITDLWFSKYGYLPDAFTRTIRELYVEKTAMKGGAQEDSVEYQIKKGELNSCYGMAAQQVLKDDTFFWGGEWYYRSELTESQRKDLGLEDLPPDEIYDEQSPLLPYQWAVWCTALARLELEEAMWECVDDQGISRLIYIDTDSLYYEGPKINWARYNKLRMLRSRRSGTYAQDAAGEMHYMGVLEEDPPYKRFRSWGAKKYLTESSKGKIKITVSGVNKKEGGEELQEAAKRSKMDPFDLFALGYTFERSAGQAAWYNDFYSGEWVTPDGKPVQLTANLYLEDTTYTISISPEYWDIIDTFSRRPYFCRKVLDMWEQGVYNTINEAKRLKQLKGGQPK